MKKLPNAHPEDRETGPVFSSGALKTIAVLSLIAAGISAYLVFMKFSGQISSIAGCGEGAGCDNLLGGRWSSWFGLPVSILGLLNYLGIAAVAVGLLVLKTSRTPLTPLLYGLSGLAAAAGLWFFSLQIFVEKAFCPYCCAIHFCGLIILGLALFQLQNLKGGGRDLKFLRPVTAAVVVMIGILIAGQTLGPAPESHRVTDTKLNSEVTEKPIEARRVASYFDGKISFDVDRIPIVGSPDAKHILVEFYDYTCGSCQKMHLYMKALQAQYGDTFGILCMPTPLNSQCNAHASAQSNSYHRYACEFAKYSLAVWDADPTKFYFFHDFLLTNASRLTAESARQRAVHLVGEEAFAASLADPWIDEILAQSTQIYGALKQTNAAMPKILLRDQRMINGRPASTERFIQILRQEFLLP